MKRRPNELRTIASCRELRRLRGELDAARGRRSRDDAQSIDGRVQAAVDVARDDGMGWTAIGDALGIRSGNAYKRYRQPPSRPRA